MRSKYKIYKTIGVIADSYIITNENGFLLEDPYHNMTYSAKSEKEARKFLKSHRKCCSRNIDPAKDEYKDEYSEISCILYYPIDIIKVNKLKNKFERSKSV